MTNTYLPQHDRHSQHHSDDSGLLPILFIFLICFVTIALIILNHQYQGSSKEVTAPDTKSIAPAVSSVKESTTPKVQETTPVTETSSDQSSSSFNKDTFFKDALFIGDSRTQGFELHSGITELGATVYAHAGLTVSEIDDLPFVNDNGTTKTVYDALSGKSFKKVFLMQGLNELGWPTATGFANKYKSFISKVQEQLPDATIYIQSILEVTKEKSDSHEYFNKKRVDTFNKEIKKLCDGKKIIYIDLNTDLCDSNGYLKAEYGSDGVHMLKSGYQIWLKELIDYFSIESNNK